MPVGSGNFNAMSEQDILSRVVMVTIEKLRVKEEEVTPTASFQ